MNMREAFKDLIILAGNAGMGYVDKRPTSDPFSYNHIVDMQMRIIGADAVNDPMSEAKIGRWLGWAECAVAAWLQQNGHTSVLDTMKELNMKWARK